MSLPPPPGYAICSITFQKAGTPNPMVTTMAVHNPTNTNANAVNTFWRASIAGTNARPFHATNMIVGYTVVETYVLLTNMAGVPSSNVNATPIVGTRVANGMPVNTSIVAAKGVAPVGRQYRGRMLWPPSWVASVNVDSDGLILAASVTTLQGFASSFLTALTTNTIPPVLLHQPPQGGGPTPAPTAVSSLTIRNRIGTIRHRIRR